MLTSVNKKQLKKTAEWGVMLLAFVFVFYFIFSNYQNLAQNLRQGRWGYLVLSVAVFWLYFACRAVAWWLAVKSLGGNIRLIEGIRVWIKAEFSRYIPGNVWSFLSRVYLAKEQGVKKSITLPSLGLEMILLVGSAALLVGPFIALIPSLSQKYAPQLMLISLPALAVILLPKVVAGAVNWILKALKQPVPPFVLDRWTVIKISVLFVLGWGFFGLASLLAAKSLIGDLSINAVWLVGAFVIAWLIGYVSLIAPMGLGVREGTLIALIGPVIGGGLAAMAALMSRFSLLISELVVLGAAYLWNGRSRANKHTSKILAFAKNHRWTIIIIAAMAAYAGYFGTYNFLRYYHFIATRFDLAIMDQVVWNTSQGDILQLTNPYSTETINRFFIHADWFLAMLAPLYWIAPSPATLIYLQAIVVALGALPLFWLARDVLRNNLLSLVITLGYLMFGPLQRAVIFDFHSVTLASTFFICCFYFLYKKRYFWYIVFLVLLISTKETMALVAVMMGLYIWLIRKNWRLGVGTLALGSIWFYLLLYWIMPSARGGESIHFAFEYYSRFGETPLQVITTLIFQPRRWISELVQIDRLKYFSIFLVPTGLLPLLSPVSLIAIPELAINLLSEYQPMRDVRHHYTSVIAAIAFVALIFGAKKGMALLERVKFLSKKHWAGVMAVYLVMVSLISSWNWSPLPGMKRAEVGAFSYRMESAPYLRQLSREIPRGSAVSTTTHLAPHFSQRKDNFAFPLGIEKAQYLIIQRSMAYEIRSSQEVEEAVAKLLVDPRFRKIYEKGNIIVFERIAPHD